ncbi:MAG: DUF3604 domain-containing protein [Halieaceae bacterium]|nr:DUF3604 domain-containing protein [Halieaceae bacterium]
MHRLILSAAILLSACGGETPLTEQTNDFAGRGSNNPNTLLEPLTGLLDLAPPPANPERNAYFGDLHVHTAYSFDAYAFGTTATPYDAYRYARGEALTHPSGYQIQLQTPLDFYAVTDHAMFLGVVKEAADTRSEFSRYQIAESLHDINDPDNMDRGSITQRVRLFANFIPDMLEGLQNGSIDPELSNGITRRAWLDTIRAAGQFNEPGQFTTFVAYEYTSGSDDRGNLHRNVIFRGAERLPVAPFSRFNSQNPEGLWDWMDGLREQGVESLAIPHNSNGSNGQMFKLEDWAGNPLDDQYAARRMRNEPLVEVTQIKGTSDTHPLLSPNDEWANFEIYPFRVGTSLPSQPSGGYVREAYLNGLALEAQGIANPFRFGLVAASDTHVAGAGFDEASFFSKAGILDGDAVGRGSVSPSFLYGAMIRLMEPELIREVEGRKYIGNSGFETWSASGISGVWAEENTREAIYSAFHRKETFATSGPRIKLRFFAGTSFEPTMLQAGDMVRQAYEQGVSMGGELAAAGSAPKFLVWAVGDPLGAPLQRLQIIKGYLKNDQPVEKIFDVACADGFQPGPGHRCPDNGARVNLADCSISAELGDVELLTLWEDPEYDAELDAFYYVRVLENPTCRWSTWDALRAGVAPRSDLPATIQERAWTSPIWVR